MVNEKQRYSLNAIVFVHNREKTSGKKKLKKDTRLKLYLFIDLTSERRNFKREQKNERKVNPERTS